MILSMPDQAWLFLTTVGVGAGVGLFYDFFRVLRKTAPHGKIAVQIEDILFWVAVTVVIFYYLLHRNFGEIRVFVLLGIGIGAVLYLATVSFWVVKCAVLVVEYLKKVIAAIFNIIALPFRFLFNFLAPPAKKASLAARKHLRKLGRYGKIKAQKTARNVKIMRKKV